MSEINETFTERVDATQPDGAFIGTMEIGVRPGSVEQEQVATLIEENNGLRDRIAELERQLNA